MGSFWVLSGVLILVAFVYFFRAWHGCHSRPWMLVAGLMGLFLGVILTMVAFSIATNVKQRTSLEFGCIPAFMCLLAVILHCCLALESSNINVQRQAERVVEGLVIACMFWSLAVLLEPIQIVHETGPRTTCKINLKKIGLFSYEWAEAHDQRFPDSGIQNGGQPPHSWRIELLNFTDQAHLYRRYDQTRAWDSAANRSIAGQQVGWLSCPTLPHELQSNDQGQFYSSYALVIGDETAYPSGKGQRLDNFPDGTSTTVLAVEACGRQIIWTQPLDISLTANTVGINLAGTQPNQSPGVWSSYHPGGAFVLKADGSVRFLSQKTSPQVLHAILTRNGGEKVDLDGF